jgi:hypothetical protein
MIYICIDTISHVFYSVAEFNEESGTIPTSNRSEACLSCMCSGSDFKKKKMIHNYIDRPAKGLVMRCNSHRRKEGRKARKRGWIERVEIELKSQWEER